MSALSVNWLVLADYSFLVLHTTLILFNLFGWMVKKWQRAHFLTISLTFLSWFFLGIWYGWGYCFLTDWHWQILRDLGESSMPNSYISYLFSRFFGILPPARWVDFFTVLLAFLALIASVWVNFFQTKR
ncbi:Protein of Unknown function [Cyclobacterium lianum]|uniref:DUF2784 domain-containing protein n=1 Tax=Cyclobacterium lianum TaxID=388280 RepID=A0A1M7Q6Y0_9BACT|nr:DUF2784 family protein [Cyclobacterium lianum]SHN26048.1 Protein of Unknown function [Cyclobacterium lianum]